MMDSLTAENINDKNQIVDNSIFVLAQHYTTLLDYRTFIGVYRRDWVPSFVKPNAIDCIHRLSE